MIITLAIAVIALGVPIAAYAQSNQQDWKQSPTGLAVSPGDEAGELVITWDANSQDSKTLSDYRVAWTPDGEGFKPNSETDWNAFPTSNELVVTGLSAGATYKVKVRARYDDSKISKWSDVVSGQSGVTPNSPATGQPTISGIAEVGDTLTAGTSAIADDNGLTNAVPSHQWVRSTAGSHTDIPGATNASYVITPADAESKIKVRVSFTDDDGYLETLTSAATASVPEPEGEQPQRDKSDGDDKNVTPRHSHLAAPTNLRVTNRTVNSITFAWNAATDSTVTHTYIQHVSSGTTTDLTFAEIRTSFTVMNLTQNTSVAFQVRWATGTAVANRGAHTGRVTNTLEDKQAQHLAASPTAESVTLTWDNPTNYNVTGFEIERRTGSGSYTTLQNRTTNDTGYTDSNVVGNTTYTYRVTISHRPSGEIISQRGNSVTRNVTTPDYSDVAAPSNFRITNATLTNGVYVLANHDDQPMLDWDKPTGATGYKFTRKWNDSDATCGNICPWLVVALAKGTGHSYFTDRYIAPAKYTFRIRGLDNNNNPGQAAEITVLLPDGPPYVPEAPTNFTVTGGRYGLAATLEGEWHRNDSPRHKIPPAFVVQWKKAGQEYNTNLTDNRSLINAWSGPHMLGADGNDQWSPAWNKFKLRHNQQRHGITPNLALDTEYTVRVGMCLTTTCDLGDVVFAAGRSVRTAAAQ